MLAGVVTAFVCFLPAAAGASGAARENGRPLIAVFPPNSYGGHPQVWGAAQDRDGLIYLAAAGAIHIYDGSTWRSVISPNAEVMRSVIGTPQGIYWGSEGDFGVLEPKPGGALHFVSLLPFVAKPDRAFERVTQVLSVGRGALFRSRWHLFLWPGAGGPLKVWRLPESPDTGFDAVGQVGGRTLLASRGAGLLELHQGAWRSLPGSRLPPEQKVAAITSGPRGGLVVVTEAGGLFLYDGGGITSWPGEVSDFARRSKARRVADLGGGRFALGSAQGGVAVVDAEGRVLRLLNEAAGLPDASVNDLFVDAEQGLWVSTNQGVARVDLASGIDVFDESLGLLGAPIRALRFGGTLYLGTTRGLFVVEPSRIPGGLVHFVPVEGVSAECWDLAGFQGRLVAATSAGLLEVGGGAAVPIPWKGEIALALLASRDGRRLWVGSDVDGLWVLEGSEGRIAAPRRVEGVSRQVRGLVEDGAGRIWLRIELEGRERIERLEPEAMAVAGKVRVFGPADGLPEGVERVPVLWQGELLVSGVGEVFRWIPARDRFVPDTAVAAALAPALLVNRLWGDGSGRIWAPSVLEASSGVPEDVLRHALLAGKGGGPARYPLEPLGEVSVESFYADGDAVWAASRDGRLLRLGAAALARAMGDAPPAPRLRRVRLLGAPDEVLFDGAGGFGRAPEIPWGPRALRFEAAVPRFDVPGGYLLQSRLLGLGEGWGPWSTETYRDFTGLPAGSYTFEVRGGRPGGEPGPATAFAFQVLAPWYRTAWAYGLYGLALLAAAGALVRKVQNTVLRERLKNARLRELDRLKSSFLANTSHELRTPVFGIVGLAEQLSTRAAPVLPPVDRERLEALVSSGHRLQRLLDNLDDFSQLQRGALTLDRRPVELRPAVAAAIHLVRPFAHDKPLELINAVPQEAAAADADPRRLEQILFHLLRNAVQYTAAGRVEVSLREEGNELTLRVADTGCGIAAKGRELLFEAFEKPDAPGSEAGGTGMGLALVRRLVELHGGRISLESTSPAGSVFAFTLPRAARAKAAVPPSSPTSETTPAGPPCILVVDDEPVNRLILKLYLETGGCKVRQAVDGPEALASIAAERPDLVLLDVMMPQMNGFEVCRRLRERFAPDELPVVFVSAKSQPADRAEGLAAGGNDYLTKPVSQEDLIQHVRALL